MSEGRLLSSILNIGEEMLMAGAEVSRVEDSVTRICRAYGMKDIHVLTITSSIILTATGSTGEPHTQTRRILKYAINFTRIELLNSLSRQLCKEIPGVDYIEQELEGIRKAPVYKERTYYLAYALISASFSVFFKGSILDAAAAGLIGLLIRFIITWNRKMEMNFIVSNLICSMAGGLAALLLVSIGVGESVDKIIIGNIMLLIPGMALTNAIRDMINGDIISGGLRLIEAVLIAISIAVGFAAVLLL